MKPERFSVTIDTKGSCFLCLKSNVKSDCEEDSVCKNLLPFKMLVRYLDMDIKLLHQCLSSSVMGDKYKMISSSEVEVILCENCDNLMNEFWKWYQDFEAVRLCLDSCVESVYSILKKSELQNNCNQGWAPIPTGNEGEGSQAADVLRKETLRKCSKKLTSFPRVKLPKPREKHFSHGDEPIEEELGIQISRDDIHDEMLMTPEPNPESTLNEDPLLETDFWIPAEIGNVNFSYDSILSFNDDNVQNPQQFVEFGAMVTNETELVPSPTFESSITSESMEIEIANQETCTDDILSCSFCGHTSTNRNVLRLHVLKTHTLEIFSDQLPSGTTPLELECAIRTTVRKHMNHMFNYKKDLNLVCISCSESAASTTNLRIHIIYNHFNEVLVSLKLKDQLPSSLSTSANQNPEVNQYPNISNNLFEPGLVTNLTLNNLGGQSCSTLSNNNCPPLLPQSSTTFPLAVPQAQSEIPQHHAVQTHELAPSRKSGAIKRFSCSLCSQQLTQNGSLKLHKLLVHTFSHFKDRLPPHTTKSEMKSAIQDILSQALEGDERSRYGCPYCATQTQFTRKHSLKAHILKSHFNCIYLEIEKKQKDIVTILD